MKRTFNFFLLSIAVALQCSCNSAPVEIKLNLEVGKEYTQSNTSTITTKIGAPDGSTMNMPMTIAGVMSLIVESESDTAYLVEVKYKKLSMTMRMPQGISVTFDSERKDDIMSKSFKSIVDNPFKVILLKNGRVSSVDMSAFWGKLDSSMEWVPLMQREQVVEQMKQAYGEKAFKGNFEQLSAFLPETPVSKGGKWHTQIKLETNFPATMDSEYKLEKIAKDYFIIMGTSDISTNGLQDAITQSSSGELMQYNLTGTATSNIKIDRTTGWIIEATIKQTLKGKSIIGDVEMSMEMIGDMKYTK
jgi:hypothetical protein